MSDSKQTILVVDDERVNVNLLNEILSDEYRIKVALNGKQAIDRTESSPKPDLILLDIKMPELDGYEVCRKLNQNPETAEIPIIFITMLSNTEDEKKGLEIGAVDYITKPFNAAIIKARIKTQLRLKRYIEELANKNNELVRLNDSKNRFFKIIAHDLRSPIGAIHSLNEMLYKKHNDYDNEQINEILKLLCESSKRTFGLLENLLEWSKAESGQLTVQLETIDLNKVIYEVIELMSTLFKEKAVKLLFDINENCSVISDKNIINTVLRNLLSNALKFSHPQQEVRISLFQENGHAIIKIIDQGIGMEQNKIEDLFNLNKVESSYGTKNEKGSGLGLVLCKQLLEKVSAEIRITSELDKGSEFQVLLPLK